VTHQQIHVDDATLKLLTNRLFESGIEVYDAQELQRVYRFRIVKAMTNGTFGDVFPSPYIEDINAFVKQAISDGSDHVVLSIITNHRGLGSFLYEIQTSPKGISLSQAIMWHVPKKPGDRTLPQMMMDYPHLALDVSLSG